MRFIPIVQDVYRFYWGALFGQMTYDQWQEFEKVAGAFCQIDKTRFEETNS